MLEQPSTLLIAGAPAADRELGRTAAPGHDRHGAVGGTARVHEGAAAVLVLGRGAAGSAAAPVPELLAGYAVAVGVEARGRATGRKQAEGSYGSAPTRILGSSSWARAAVSLTPRTCARGPLRRSWSAGLGNQSITFHDLRHTCASLLFQKNVHPKFVQELMGHATIAITLDTYSHVIPSMGDHTARAMEDALEDRAEKGNADGLSGG